jgi:hypothetical protein
LHSHPTDPPTRHFLLQVARAVAEVPFGVADVERLPDEEEPEEWQPLVRNRGVRLDLSPLGPRLDGVSFGLL